MKWIFVSYLMFVCMLSAAHEKSSWQLEGKRVEHLNIRHSSVHQVPCHVHIYEDLDGSRRRYEWDWQPSDGPLDDAAPIESPPVEPEPTRLPVIPVEPKPVMTDIGVVHEPIESTFTGGYYVAEEDTEANSSVLVETQPPVKKEVAMVVKEREPLEIIVTEIMFHDLGMQDVSQWIELYNAGHKGSIAGWSMRAATDRKSTSQRGGDAVVVFEDHFIEAGGTLILACKPETDWHRSIENYGVYPMRNLKNKWKLVDRDGNVIYERKDEWHRGWGSKGKENRRKSVKVVPSGVQHGNHYYGRETDIGTPGWHAPIPSAPSLVPLKRATTWGALKR